MPGTTLVQNATAEGANTGVTWYSYNYVRAAVPRLSAAPAPRRRRGAACGLAGLARAHAGWQCGGGSKSQGLWAGGPASSVSCACTGLRCGERGARAAQGPIHFLSYDSEVPYDVGTAQHACAPPSPSPLLQRGAASVACSRVRESKQRAAGDAPWHTHVKAAPSSTVLPASGPVPPAR